MEAAHDVGLGVVRADVLCSGQTLFQEAERVRTGGPVGLPVRHGDVADAREHQHPGNHEDGQRQAGPPVLAQQQHEDADQQKQAPEHLEDEQREEAAQLVRVAVDTLDHLPGGAVVVVRHVQRQRVRGEVLADVVGGRPAHPLREVGGDDLHDLLKHRDGHERDRRDRERLHRGALLCLVYEVADYLRQDELKPKAEEEQNAQGDHERKLRPQVAPKQAAVLAPLDLDGRLTEPNGKAHDDLSFVRRQSLDMALVLNAQVTRLDGDRTNIGHVYRSWSCP